MALSVSEKLKFCWYCCRQVDPRPENSHLFYNFSQFTMGLNEMSPNYLGSDRILPPSDCRLRPDLRALENGDLEVAKTFNPFQNLDHSRCDHIGPFWMVLVSNFPAKVAQIYGKFMGSFTTTLFSVKTVLQLGQRLEEIWILFILTSGRTGHWGLFW